jgi:hypothetical protein
MKNKSGDLNLKSRLKEYKNRFYLNLLVKGSIIFTAIALTAFLLVNVLEYSLRFNTSFRAILFFSFILLLFIFFFRWILSPGSRWFIPNRQIKDEDAARQIGNYFPGVKDKLLNIVQLQRLSNEGNALVSASILQKQKDISWVNFTEAVNLKGNVKFLKFALIPLAIVLVLVLVYPAVITESTTRLIHYNKEFVPKAPFNFNLLNKELQGFKNEDYVLELELTGDVIPENVYLDLGERRVKMAKAENNLFNYTFSKIQNNQDFNFDAAGYKSKNYNLAVVSRPNIRNFNMYLNYPGYLNKNNERISNSGNVQVPEGTEIRWQFNTIESDSVAIYFENSSETAAFDKVDTELFEYQKQMFVSDNYQVQLKNGFSNNKDKIQYRIQVIKDEYPLIDLDKFQDTTFYNYIILGGNISDDYGLRSLALYYKIYETANNRPDDYTRIPIRIDKEKASQSYYYQWRLDSLRLNEGSNVDYFLIVSDNDGINGSKTTKSGTYTFKVPTLKEVRKDLENSSENSRKQIDKSLQMAEDLNKKLEQAEERLKGKKELSWQDEKSINEILKQKEKLQEEIEKLKEQFKNDVDKRERFDQLENKQIKEKVEQLQQLMNEVLDEETKKLYEELQKLLEEKKDLTDIKDMLNKINRNEKNLEKELERTLELFKRLKYEMKLDELVKDLEQNADKQEELSEKTGEKNENLEKIKEEQKEIDQKFDENQEKKNELEELNKELKNPNPIQNTEQLEEEIQVRQEEIQENLEKGKPQKAQENQKQNAQKMKQMAQQMAQMQQNMNMNMMQENMDNLRDIVDNLVKLSFDQENLMVDFRKVNQSDPRFVDLSQVQLKLKDDAKIIEDSLNALAQRVFQIQSFVTREVGNMNQYMEESLEMLKERKKAQAIGKQQFSMTSMNNLALLLDDVLTQMQKAMADAMGMPQKKQGQQPTPGLTELQKQLNDKIQDIKKSGKSGRELSEELAKLAAEQEQLRNELRKQSEKLNQSEKESGEKGGKSGTGGMQEIMQKMEDTELDLVNKQITQKTIERQQEILTRLLEAEESMRERELDENREAEHAKSQEREIPLAFEDYIKSKEQEIELLKTIPPKMNPYYKKEVNEYFRRLSKSSTF